MFHGPIDRRTVLAGLAAAATLGPIRAARAADTLRIGLLLPYSGTYAMLGENITHGLELALAETDHRLGGRPVELVRVDSQASPPKATELTTRLIESDKVDVLVGPVHSGVAMGMARIAREAGLPTIIPNAGADQLTGPLCAPNLFRTSFANWQMGYPVGKVALEDGHRKVALVYWNYGAGKQCMAGFREAFEPGGGEIVADIGVPFPEVAFQAALTQAAAAKPDAIFTFFAGGGAVKFVKDYAAAGLQGNIPLYSSGFLTEGLLEAEGPAADGIRTTLHYADLLDTPRNHAFRTAYEAATGAPADVYSVQGYDTGQLLRIGVEAVAGDLGRRDDLFGAMAAARLDSPRGTFTLSAAHNPVQDYYLLEARSGRNEVLGVAVEDLAAPSTGCRMG